MFGLSFCSIDPLITLKLCPEAAEAAPVVGAEPPKVGEHGVHEGDVAGGARGAAKSLL